MKLGLDRRVRDLAQDGRKWVALAVVTKVEEHAAWGYLLTVREQPSQRVLQARMAWPGAYVPVAVGDEVLVVYPEGRANSGVVLGGLHSKAAPVPSSFENEHVEHVHPGGTEFRLTASGSVEPVVLESLLPDLAEALGEISTALGTLGILPPVLTNLSALIVALEASYRSSALKSE